LVFQEINELSKSDFGVTISVHPPNYCKDLSFW
jgi:hypothetical protein